MVDLSKTDKFPHDNVPDEAVETTLKVLRTLRDLCLKTDLGRWADEIVVLSHAHKVIYDLAEAGNESEQTSANS